MNEDERGGVMSADVPEKLNEDKRRPVLAAWYQLEPHDGTHYEFVVFEDLGPRSVNWLTIAKGGRGAAFSTYEYSREAIAQFVASHPGPFADDPGREYGQLAQASRALLDPYLDYVAEHSACNLWTALAALRAAWFFMNGKFE